MRKNNLRTGQFGDGEAETFVNGHMAPLSYTDYLYKSNPKKLVKLVKSVYVNRY